MNCHLNIQTKNEFCYYKFKVIYNFKCYVLIYFNYTIDVIYLNWLYFSLFSYIFLKNMFVLIKSWHLNMSNVFHLKKKEEKKLIFQYKEMTPMFSKSDMYLLYFAIIISLCIYKQINITRMDVKKQKLNVFIWDW